MKACLFAVLPMMICQFFHAAVAPPVLDIKTRVLHLKAFKASLPEWVVTVWRAMEVCSLCLHGLETGSEPSALTYDGDFFNCSTCLVGFDAK